LIYNEDKKANTTNLKIMKTNNDSSFNSCAPDHAPLPKKSSMISAKKGIEIAAILFLLVVAKDIAVNIGDTMNGGSTSITKYAQQAKEAANEIERINARQLHKETEELLAKIDAEKNAKAFAAQNTKPLPACDEDSNTDPSQPYYACK
jgi:hypothetical protein